MQLFISWSGDRSKAVAAAIRDWLPLVIQSVKPWFSPEDIDKGARWLADLNTQLEKQSIAVICVTPESLNAPWLLFETGALSKALESSWVCPVLYGMEPTDIQGPLAQFQATRATKEDMRRLLSTVNKRLDSPLLDQHLDTLHDLLWPQLAAKFEEIGKMSGAQKAPHRQTPEMLSEMLARVRSIERQLSDNRGRDDWLRRRGLFGAKGAPSLERITELKERVPFLSRRIQEFERSRALMEAKLEELPANDAGSKGELLAQRDHFAARQMMYRRELDAIKEISSELLGALEGVPPLLK